MPTARIPMKQIIEVLRLKYEAKLSHEKIARACQLSKGAVSKYVSLAKAKGVTWPLAEDVDEVALEALLFPAKEKPERFVRPDCFQIHQELKRKGVTLQLLWAEYVTRHGERAYRYTQFCHHYRKWRDRQKRSMRQQHRAGEKALIDYAGPTVPVVDRHTGEIRNARVFVGVLGASSYTYAEATHTQSLPDWIGSHQRMLKYFGGVPELFVPDYVPGNIIWEHLLRDALEVVEGMLVAALERLEPLIGHELHVGVTTPAQCGNKGRQRPATPPKYTPVRLHMLARCCLKTHHGIRARREP